MRFRLLQPWPALAIAFLAAASSATGLWGGFVYDDVHIIAQNARLHSLHHWWALFGQSYWPPNRGMGLYRPVSTLAFAAQWVLGGGAPWLFHLTSVALYVAVSLAVFGLASAVLPLPAAWLAAAVFAVHPVHVEAVANIVGQGELIAALAVVSAASLYIRGRAAGRLTAPRSMAVGGLFLVGCLAKEVAFVLPALLSAAEALVVYDLRPLRARLRELAPLYGGLALVGSFLLAVRARILGTLAGDDPSLLMQRLSWGGRAVTMLGVVPEYFRLLVWPARLSADYSPQQITALAPTDLAVVLGVLLLGAIVALAVECVRARPVLAFGTAWAAIALLPVCNLLVISGVVLAERTLFLPSVGFVLGVGGAAAYAGARLRNAAPGRRRLAAAAAALLLLGGVARSADRQQVWRDNDVLFAQMLLDAPRSYRAHWARSANLFERGDSVGGERELRHAIALFPYDAEPMVDLANKYRHGRRCLPAEVLYRQVLGMQPINADARRGLVACLLLRGDYQAARAEAQTGIAYGYAAGDFRRVVAIADSMLAVRTPRGG